MPISSKKQSDFIRAVMEKMKPLQNKGVIPVLAFMKVTGYTKTSFYKWLNKGNKYINQGVEQNDEPINEEREAIIAYIEFSKFVNTYSAELEINVIQKIKEEPDWQREATILKIITGERYQNNITDDDNEDTKVTGFRLVLDKKIQ